jgi:hypothetical protein
VYAVELAQYCSKMKAPALVIKLDFGRPLIRNAGVTGFRTEALFGQLAQLTVLNSGMPQVRRTNRLPHFWRTVARILIAKQHVGLRRA